MSTLNMLSPPPSSNEDSSAYSPQSNEFHYNVHSISLQSTNSENAPYLNIIEQPMDRFRFRYKSEMTGTHGSLCGIHSDRTRKLTYPSVELRNFQGKAMIRCSIYQHNTQDDHKPHAHRLVMKKGKDEVDDPHDVYVTREEKYFHTFHNMGIIHTAKKNIESELVRKKNSLKMEEIARQEGKSRPLNVKEEVEIKGLAAAESKSINLNVVRLRFDAFVVQKGILTPICPPVFSNPINNLKSALTGELKIVRMDKVSCQAKGNDEMFILVERVAKKNIRVRFYELDDDNVVVWQDYGRFSDLDVHHQYAIVLKVPPYKDVNIKQPVRVLIELERPTDRSTSEPREFQYTPVLTMYQPGAKRARTYMEEELPTTVNELSLNGSNSEDVLNMPSEDLFKALNDFNSDEFAKIYDSVKDEYGNESFDFDGTPIYVGNSKNDSSVYLMRNGAKVLKADLLQAKQTVHELTKFLKTGPHTKQAIGIINYHLSEEHKTNALHTTIKLNEKAMVTLLLKAIYIYKQHNLLNIRNDEGESALHIAVTLKNTEMVRHLIMSKADINLRNDQGNTALHLAVLHDVPNTILGLIATNGTCQLDLENTDGFTALMLAVENENVRMVEMLLKFGSKPNLRHKKHGYTALRFAIEKEHLEIVKCLLERSDGMVEDFNRITPVQAALKRSNQTLIAMVNEYVDKNDLGDVEVKSEAEDNGSDDEMDDDDDRKVKTEELGDLRQMYANVTEFPPQCLEQVAKILDQSGSYENLADLLDLGYLLRSGLSDKMSSPSQLLLKVAVETNEDTVLQIRDFLDDLDETEAVELIDNMVKSRHHI